MTAGAHFEHLPTAAIPIASPLDANDLRTRVQHCIDAFLNRQSNLLLSVSPDTEPLLASITELLSGGKRLRPAFCYWGWRAAGAPDNAEIVRAASSLEMLQGCALVHDDVMDDSATRRGRPAAHRKFANLHTENSWLGPANRFGVGAAILIGDLLLSWTDEMLLTSGLDEDALQRGKSVLDLMRSELMAGQYLDLLTQANRNGSVEKAKHVIKYKSAKYTIERPLHMGARLAGAPETTINALSNYGLPLGEAFQLRDDVLGVFGNPNVTGKPAGDDLREGKRTVLIELAISRAHPTQLKALETLLGDENLSQEGVEGLREILIETGSLADVENMIETSTQQAITNLERANLNQQATLILTDLAKAATARVE
jgi:geranylgeranyl diphosphate synthase type I